VAGGGLGKARQVDFTPVLQQNNIRPGGISICTTCCAPITPSTST
jgi:hypothetical protein